MDNVDVVKSLSTRFLSAQPSCIDFSKPIPNVFVIGTYQLDEPSAATPDRSDAAEEAPSPQQSRSGSLQLFRLESDNTTTTFLQHLLTPSAILDLRFSPSRPDILAAGTSTGSISLYRLSSPTSTPPSQNPNSPTPPSSPEHSSVPTLILSKTLQAFDARTLVLSLAWNPSQHPPRRSEAAASLSDGTIATLDLGPEASVKARVPAHGLEVWSVAWSGGKGRNIFPSSSSSSRPPSSTFQSGTKEPGAGSQGRQGAGPEPKAGGRADAGRVLFSGGDDGMVRALDAGDGACAPSGPSTCSAHDGGGDGGDGNAPDPADAALRRSATPFMAGRVQLAQPTALSRWDRRTHGAGVTAVVPLPLLVHDEARRDGRHVLLTGSYDEH
ncbi:MAG: hypothetical protein LQ340_002000, partial [Diploschistes diacapsis]